jgi:hypothetical protein
MILWADNNNKIIQKVRSGEALLMIGQIQILQIAADRLG